MTDPAGVADIGARVLSRPASKPLLIIDVQRSAGQWLALVRGCGPAEAPQATARMSLADALQAVDFPLPHGRLVDPG